MTTSVDKLAAEGANIAVCAKVLGTLFYYPPEHAASRECVALLAGLADVWPYGCAADLTTIERDMYLPPAAGEVYQTLFVGPTHFEASPWGSVYLDEESVLFGSSTLAWRAFLQRYGLALTATHNEPEDHFGLMWLAMATLAEQGEWAALQALFEEHLLPWSGRYLELLQGAAPAGLYRAIGQLAALTLTAIVDATQLHPHNKALFA
jgi:putative dimethyl sulfoxide reductase chaperone